MFYAEFDMIRIKHILCLKVLILSERWPYEKRMPLAKIRIDAKKTIEKATVALGDN